MCGELYKDWELKWIRAVTILNTLDLICCNILATSVLCCKYCSPCFLIITDPRDPRTVGAKWSNPGKNCFQQGPPLKTFIPPIFARFIFILPWLTAIGSHEFVMVCCFSLVTNKIVLALITGYNSNLVFRVVLTDPTQGQGAKLK